MKVGVPGVGAAGGEAAGGVGTTLGGGATVVVVVVVGVTCHWANKEADPSIGRVYSSPARQGEPEPSIWVFQPANV